jgi:hypothetical protein
MVFFIKVFLRGFAEANRMMVYSKSIPQHVSDQHVSEKS